MVDFLFHLNPGFVIILAGMIALILPIKFLRDCLTLLAPVAALILILRTDLALPFGMEGVEISVKGELDLLGMSLVTYRLDNLSYVFALIFILANFIGTVYALHSRDRLQQGMANIYGGAAVGAVLAGDLLTFFLFWEITALASVFLIWAAHSREALHAGIRYLIMQIGSGVLLLIGALLIYEQSGSLLFEKISLDSLGGWLILIAFGIKCAFPFLHNWLQDSYPRATVTGAVILSAFTTKLAVYALARGFAGTEFLIPIGVAMTLFPVFFAVIENDLRKVLAYSLNNQLGFMVVGVGVGTQLALNGTAAHAFSHILYKALLFMSMGAVLHRLGTVKASELGGLYRTMPITAIFCIIGAASISAFPLLSGFVSKSIVLAALAKEQIWWAWFGLLIASAGVLEHSGIKIPYFAFFAHDSGKRPSEAPPNMLFAMFIAAFACIYIGVNPDFLYSLLPYSHLLLSDHPKFEPYTFEHVLTQMQLLLAAMAAFALLKALGLYPAERDRTIIDFDWFYRVPAAVIAKTGGRAIGGAWSGLSRSGAALFETIRQGNQTFGLRQSVGSEMALATGALLLFLLLVFLFTSL